jgi:DNA-binding GntR family transcriptional regulator
LKGRKGATRVFTAVLGDAAAPAHHAAFLAAFREGDFEEANKLLARLQSTSPTPLLDLYRVYRARLDTASAERSTDWDGVYDPDRR